MAYLEKHQIRICQLAAVQPGSIPTGLALEDALKVAQKLGKTVRNVVLGLS